MTPLVLDTHALVWFIRGDRSLAAPARQAILDATDLSVSAVSIYEIGQKVRLGKWPDMEDSIGHLIDELQIHSVDLMALSPEIAYLASLLDWPHRDPFDRMIAATCIVRGARLVSADPAFDSLQDRMFLPRLWAD